MAAKKTALNNSRQAAVEKFLATNLGAGTATP
jgi:hypothetical protein